MTTIVTEKRLYETPDGDLVEELKDSGSLFCGVGAELTGDDAKRYLAYEKAVPEAEDKEAPRASNKAKSKRRKADKKAVDVKEVVVETAAVEAPEMPSWSRSREG